ncbi:MAG TPA: M14 family metallopeptidase, partial [Chitinophagaceae bacterium]|nr:M14 family metallopeptidase [Chitinophagaceae bacterium]
ILLSDPSRSSSVNIDNMPIVVWIGHSIHGNEPSGANASLLTAYYLAAAQGKYIDDLLEHVVILFDPSFNPDGLQRFSTWANQHKSKNLVADPASREFNEVWPGGRYNHYWFDINRDWLPAVHPESQHRLEWFHRWKPNILTDHHEQGSNATFFFQPGVPSRVNPLTPEKNQQLTEKLAAFHAHSLDSIGSLYFTKENYDDFYYGKGSTYPDINGCIGILFEQASSRGHARETSNGLLTFPFTIRNQFVTALSTLEGARVLRKEFLAWQREFYKNAESNSGSVNGYVFGDKYDEARTNLFIKMLLRHQIQVNELGDDWKNGEFEKGKSYAVSLKQPQSTLIKAIFENVPVYKDSLFYDITAWNMPLAFGLPYFAITNEKNIFGKTVTDVPVAGLSTTPSLSSYGYLLEWDDYYAPAALYALQDMGIRAKVAGKPFEMPIAGKNMAFDYGTILVPVTMQSISAEVIYQKITALAKEYGLKVYPLATGYTTEGINPGSSNFNALEKPSIALITGSGANPLDAGEVWHLLDQRMNIPCVQLEQSTFNRTDLNRYNTIIMVGGNYGEISKDKLKAWVQAGGTLIVTEEAVSWASQNGISNIRFKRVRPATDSADRLAYVQREEIEGAQQMRGAIFRADVDLSHPLAYGYNQPTVSMFKANKVFMQKSKNPFATPFYFGSNPLQSGWLSKENLEAVKNSASVIVNAVGGGRVISMADNPNFRAFWLGGTKLFMNAIFFGSTISAASSREEE